MHFVISPVCLTHADVEEGFGGNSRGVKACRGGQTLPPQWQHHGVQTQPQTHRYLTFPIYISLTVFHKILQCVLFFSHYTDRASVDRPPRTRSLSPSPPPVCHSSQSLLEGAPLSHIHKHSTRRRHNKVGQVQNQCRKTQVRPGVRSAHKHKAVIYKLTVDSKHVHDSGVGTIIVIVIIIIDTVWFYLDGESLFAAFGVL